jgi:hypothetical protein
VSESPANAEGVRDAEGWLRRHVATLLAGVVFAVTTLTLFAPIIGPGMSEQTLLSSFNRLNDDGSRQLTAPEADSLIHTDNRYMVWLTAHGAHSLLHHPWAFFDAEGCFPGENTLAYGETGLTLGLIGLPVFLLTGDAVLTFNAVLLLLSWIAAFAMFVLVRAWTGVAAAGIVAGVLYGYSEIRAGDVVHLNIFDTAWTVLALFFAQRMFTRQRWPDALGLAICIVLQMGASFYTLVAGALVGLPVAVWLIIAHGWRALRPAHVAAVIGLVGVAALLLFRPYLAFAESGVLPDQPNQYYGALSLLLPESTAFFGWTTLLLAAFAGLAPRRRLSLVVGDPRVALLAGTGLVLLFSIGAISHVGLVPIASDGDDLTAYRLLTMIVPGLDVIRSPAAMIPAAHIGAAVLAGVGAASLLQLAPKPSTRLALSTALIALAILETIRPAALGLTPRTLYAPIRTAPDAETVALYHEAAALGDEGPILVLPIQPRDLRAASRGVLLSAYHWRHTSACYNFVHVRPGLRDVAQRLPHPEAVEALLEMGFASVALQHGPGAHNANLIRLRFDAQAGGGGTSRLEHVVGNRALTLYRLTAGVP